MSASVVDVGELIRELGQSDEGLLQLYTGMVKIREFEERVQLSYLDGLVHGTTHLCQGQEAVCVGVVEGVNPDDYLSYTYRGHGTCIARGISYAGAFAEIFGRESGVSKGLGGSMHLTDPEIGLLGSFGIVGAGLPFATGLGLSCQLENRQRIAVSFFGDGACNIGAFHESLNLAAVWRLPVLFVCENNLYGEFSRINHTTTTEDLYERAEAYGIASEAVDGNDVLAVLKSTRQAAERAREGKGPTFLECKTYRQRGHSRTDPAKYRSEEELQAWLKRDPLITFRQMLIERGIIDEEKAEELVESIREEMKSAADTAASHPFPEARDFLPETYVI